MQSETTKKKKGSNCLIVLGSLLIIAALIPVVVHFILGQRAVIEPSHEGPATYDTEGFPDVDWEYWKSINPDVIGWITVPGTNIDYVIVQAQKGDPQFYLTHDVFGNYNIFGCPYLDYKCETQGLLSLNSVIYGHNMLDGSMFANFDNYIDRGFAKDHAKVLLQTPAWKKVLTVSSATVLNADTFEMRFNFPLYTELQSWYDKQFMNHEMQLENNEKAKNLYSFITCSYTTYYNERTWVSAQEVS